MRGIIAGLVVGSFILTVFLYRANQKLKEELTLTQASLDSCTFTQEALDRKRKRDNEIDNLSLPDLLDSALGWVRREGIISDRQ